MPAAAIGGDGDSPTYSTPVRGLYEAVRIFVLRSRKNEFVFYHHQVIRLFLYLPTVTRQNSGHPLDDNFQRRKK